VKRTELAVLATLLVLALSVAPALLAQTGVGAARGSVTDEQGGRVTGATVTMTNTDTGYSRSQKTEADGSYVFESLPIGRYSLSVSAPTFRSFSVRDIILHVNDNLTFDAQLKVGAINETIEITADTTQVELTNAELSSTVTGEQATQLPLNGRSFAQLLTLVPGVAV
jgi:hypothetical protein